MEMSLCIIIVVLNVSDEVVLAHLACVPVSRFCEFLTGFQNEITRKSLDSYLGSKQIASVEFQPACR